MKAAALLHNGECLRVPTAGCMYFGMEDQSRLIKYLLHRFGSAI
jgi:hypothetical protein